MPDNRKPIPRAVLIFGAAAHIGGPLAAFLTREAPGMRLRLATSDPAKAPGLAARFPAAEVVVADLRDSATLAPAVEGIEGVFLLTPSGTEERPPMTNLTAALTRAGRVIQIIRLLGIQPEANPARIPQSLRDHGLGLPIQHPIAKAILDESGLPVTYLNSGASFMDNFLWMAEPLRERRTLVWPERMIPYVDPRDVAEAAGRLLLSDNPRHIGQFHTMNNGHDMLRFAEVAAMMSEIWGEPIAYDGSRAGFFATYAPMGERRLQYLWDFFAYEAANDVVWARNDFMERILGRKPVTLAAWLAEHRDRILT